jgi:hypothetical protein
MCQNWLCPNALGRQSGLAVFLGNDPDFAAALQIGSFNIVEFVHRCVTIKTKRSNSRQMPFQISASRMHRFVVILTLAGIAAEAQNRQTRSKTIKNLWATL